MKNFVKVLMPIGAFVLASAGAVSTNAISNSKSAVVDIQGYNRQSPLEPCEEVRLCNNQGSTICTQAGEQVFEKVGSNCSKELYHQEQ